MRPGSFFIVLALSTNIKGAELDSGLSHSPLEQDQNIRHYSAYDSDCLKTWRCGPEKQYYCSKISGKWLCLGTKCPNFPCGNDWFQCNNECGCDPGPPLRRGLAVDHLGHCYEP